MPTSRVIPPRSWESPAEHWRTALTHPWYRGLVVVHHSLQASIHRFFSERAIISLAMPVTTGSISSPFGLGSDSMPVEVEICGVRTYLADSMQFMLEFGCRLHTPGVYYIMPCFRGEATDSYHLPQFYHAEVEIEGTLDDIVALGSDLVHHAAEYLLEECPDDVQRLAGGTDHLEELIVAGGGFPRIRMEDALTDLRGGDPDWITHHPAGFELVARAGEMELIRRHGTAGALWLTHSEHLSVPFYQGYEYGSNRALDADLLLGTCETIGAGQRHQTAEALARALDEHQVAPKPYQWYIELREERPMRTCGMGMGLERFLLWALRHDDIRDLTLLFRANGVHVVP